MKAIVGLLLLAICVSSSFAMNYTDVKCMQYPPPMNGDLICEHTRPVGTSCYVVCKDGYDVTYLQAEQYLCGPEGQWHVKPETMKMPWPNCIVIEPGMPIA